MSWNNGNCVIAFQFSNTSFDQKSPRHPKGGVSQFHRQTHTHTVTQTDMATLWLTRPRVTVSDNLENKNSIFVRAWCLRVLWDKLWILKPRPFLWFFWFCQICLMSWYLQQGAQSKLFFCKCSLMYYFIFKKFPQMWHNQLDLCDYPCGKDI